MSLRSRMILHYCLGLPISSAMLFLPAGTWRFWQAWVFLALAFTFLFFVFIYFYQNDQQLLERRFRSNEKISEQKRLIRLLKLYFFVIILLPGFDHRWGWSRRLLGGVPLWLSLVAEAMVLGGLLLIFWVMKVNSFASRTIEVEPGQKVISSGPYALVRHPLYSGSLLIWLFAPLELGSYVAWPAFALLVPLYVYRLLNEEKFLRRELPGYAEYCLLTRFRLAPFIW